MRILIVEDEHKIANSIRKGLQLENYAVDVAYTGTDGYDLASSEEYDLILLDILLPGMSGVEIAKKLRAEAVHTPILLLTAKGQVSDKVEGLNAGADDYLTKPFAFEELLARTKALIRRPKGTIGHVLKVGDLTMDTISYEVRRGENKIKLSSKEYTLLEYLMSHANQILSKERIINHVWDYEAEILPNTVEVYVGYLRNKIDKAYPAKPALIQTLRGFGYKIGE